MNKEQAIRSGIPCFSMEEPPLYDVILHNDDVTTMEFVVDVLMDVFRKDKGTAETLMMKIHVEGSAVVGTYTIDIAMTKAKIAETKARSFGFPLIVTTSKR